MKLKPHRRYKPFGLRTLKTAFAVTAAVLFSNRFSTVSPLYAALGAIVAMDRTFSESLTGCVTQLVGVLCGGLFGYLLTLFTPTPQAWMMGLGVLLIIILCNYFKMPFTVSLSCIVFLSICVTPSDNVLRDTLYRLRDTAIGLAIALLVNITIQPYNNTKRIVSLFLQLCDSIPEYLSCCVVGEKYPDLRKLDDILSQLQSELQIFRRQRFLHLHRLRYDSVYLEGCLAACRPRSAGAGSHLLHGYLR